MLRQEQPLVAKTIFQNSSKNVQNHRKSFLPAGIEIMDFESRSRSRDVCPTTGQVCQHGWPKATNKPLLSLNLRKPQDSQEPSDSFSSFFSESLNRRNFSAARLSAATCLLGGNNPPPLSLDRCLLDGNSLGATRPSNSIEDRLLAYVPDLTLDPRFRYRVAGDDSDPTLSGWWFIISNPDLSYPQLILLRLGENEEAVCPPLIASRLTYRLLNGW